MGADPITWLAVGAITSAAAATVGSAASFIQGRQAQDIAAANAESQQQVARVESERLARDRARRMGLMRAQFGASGTSLSSSGTLDVMGEQAMEAEFDRLLVLSGGAQSAAAARNQGEFTAAGLRGQGVAQLGSAAGTLLSAAGQGAFSGGSGGINDASWAKVGRGQVRTYEPAVRTVN